MSIPILRRWQRSRAMGVLQVLLLMVGAILSVATKYANTKYCHIRQATSVPMPTPSLRPPRRSGSYAEAGVASHTSLWATANSKYEGQQRNLYSTREQLGGYVVFSWQRYFSLGASFEVAIPAGEQRLLGGELQQPGLPNGGGGLHLAGHFKLGERLRLDWVNDFWLYGMVTELGYQEPVFQNNDAYCPPLPLQMDWRERELYVTFVMRTQLTLGIAFGRTQLVLAAGARNVPHHITGQSALYTRSGGPLRFRDTFSIYPYVFAGAHIRLWRSLALTVGLSQPLYFDPVIHAPIVSVGFQIQPRDPAWPGR